MHSLSMPLSQHFQVLTRNSPNPVILGFYRGFIAYAWLIKIFTIGNGFNLQPLSSLPSQQGEEQD